MRLGVDAAPCPTHRSHHAPRGAGPLNVDAAPKRSHGASMAPPRPRVEARPSPPKRRRCASMEPLVRTQKAAALCRDQGIGLPPSGSVAATASALSFNVGNRPLSGGRASACTRTRVVIGSRFRLTRDFGGAARRTAARTSAGGSPRAAARAPALAASTQATCADAALTPHSATARTTTSAGNATAVSAVTKPRWPRPSVCSAGTGERLPARSTRGRRRCRVFRWLHGVVALTDG